VNLEIPQILHAQCAVDFLQAFSPDPDATVAVD
jgi:hypothetical protein